jgi:PAS domain S-box-containing protein
MRLSPIAIVNTGFAAALLALIIIAVATFQSFSKLRDVNILLLALCGGAATTVVSAVLLNREMQRREAADKKSTDSADQMRRLISSVRDGIFMLDPKGLVVGWNSGAQGITGYTAEEIVGRHFSTFYSDEDVKSSKPNRELEVAGKDGRVEDNGWRVRKDGSRFWANVVVTAIHDDAKTLVGFSKVVRDMTDTMLAEEKLRNSELRFRKLLDAAPDSVVIVNERGIIQIINSQTLQVFGYSSEELIGKPIEILLPQRFSSQHVALRNGYIADPQPRPMSALRDLFGLRKDGREIPIEVSLGPLATPQGLLITAAIRDVTQRKQADEALRQSEERLNLAVESAQLGVWEYDFVNDSSIRSLRHDQIMGFSTPQQEWGFERFLKIVIPEDREIARRLMTEAQSTGQLSMQCRIMWPDNSVHWISAQGKVSHDENGKPVRMRGVIADVSENRRTAQAIERLNAELQDNLARLKATNKELEAFSYSVSHDLRAPLRHVDGFVDLLKSHAGQTLDAKGQRYLGIISDSARQMGRLIDDLLAFSRMGRTELRRVNFELKMVVETCIEELSTDTAGRKIDWQIGKLPAVYGDPSMLRLAVANLLDNAVKYSRTREHAVIEIGSNGSAQETVVYVRDNGVGFDPQYTEKLFGVFQRLHRSDQFEGTGIGLANVRRIILRHGGRTWAEGAIDKGATFYFSLPGNREGQS